MSRHSQVSFMKTLTLTFWQLFSFHLVSHLKLFSLSVIPLVCLHNQALWRVTAQRAQWQLPAQCLILSSSWAVELYLCGTAQHHTGFCRQRCEICLLHTCTVQMRTPWCLHSLWDPGASRGWGALPHLCALARSCCCPSCHPMHTQVLYLPGQSGSLEDAPVSAWEALSSSQ